MAVVTSTCDSTFWLDADVLKGLQPATSPPDASTATFWSNGDPFDALLTAGASGPQVLAFDAAAVSEFVSAVPMAAGPQVLAVEPVAVAEGVVAEVTLFVTSLSVLAVEPVAVAEYPRVLAPALTLRRVVADAVQAVDIADPDPLSGIRIIERIAVTERVVAGPLYLRLSDAITVTDNAARNSRVPAKKAGLEFLRVTESVKAQLYIGGGLAARVADTVTVRESPMYIGHPPLAGIGTGIPDLGQIGIGPNPGLPAAGLGEDYGAQTAAEMPPVRTLIVPPQLFWSHVALARIEASLGSLYDPVHYPLSALVDGLPFAVCRFATLSAGVKLTFIQPVPLKVVGLINHNLDPHLHVEVLVNGALLPRTFSVQYPHCWMDLRGLVSLTNADASLWGTSVEVRIYGNSCPVALSDVVAADAITLDGTVELPFPERYGSAMSRQESEEYATRAWASGTTIRSMSLQLHVPLAKWQQLEAIGAVAGEAGVAGTTMSAVRRKPKTEK
jgi:hypothetical protein